MPEYSDIETPLVLRVSRVRLAAVCAILVFIGTSIWWAGANSPSPSIGPRLLAIPGGAIWLWAAWGLWARAERGLVMDETGLSDTDGRHIASFAQIKGLERGVFAMKPSNGALIKLNETGAIYWMPGLWWRLGTRIGIGGLTPKAPTKAFVDVLSAKLGQS